MIPKWYFITLKDPVFRSEMRQMVFDYLQTFPDAEAEEILAENELPSIYRDYINYLIVDWKLNRGA